MERIKGHYTCPACLGVGEVFSHTNDGTRETPSEDVLRRCALCVGRCQVNAARVGGMACLESLRAADVDGADWLDILIEFAEAIDEARYLASKPVDMARLAGSLVGMPPANDTKKAAS